MKRASFHVLLLGLAVTLVVLVVDRLGALTSWEWRSVDLRYRAAPGRSSPMTSRIVHVDIDDSALDRIGRWPWPRSRLAAAVDELVDAGARTIAFDLLLGEAQAPMWAPGLDEPIDHDAVLARSHANAASVLAVVIDDRKSSGPAAADRPADVQRILDALAEDIQREPGELLQQLGISGAHAEDLLRRPRAHKQAAAFHALQRMHRDGESPLDYETFEQRLAPALGASTGFFAERPLLELVWQRDVAWRAVEGMLLPGRLPGPGAGAGTVRDAAPHPVFAPHASAVGFVNIDSQKHRDGGLRDLSVVLPAPGGRALQFGLAAAAQHAGIKPADVRITDDRIELGAVSLPLRDGRLVLDWPTSSSDPPWEGLLRQSERDDRTAGHVSIREIIELADARGAQERNRRQLAAATARVLETANVPVEPGDELSDSAQAQAIDEVEFTLENPPQDGDDQAYRDHYANCQQWAEVAAAIEADAALIDEVTERLRSLVDGKLVFIGWTASGSLADFVQTAVGTRTPGVVVHAVVAHMALTGDSIELSRPALNALAVLAMGLLCTLAAGWFSALRSSILAVVLLTAYTAAAGIWLFSFHDLIVPLVAPLCAGGGSWTACTALQAALSQRERRRISRQFRARVSSQLVDHLVKNPNAISVAGTEREMTIFFGDLAGFTTLSEQLGGSRTVSVLNRCMTALADTLVEHGAYVNKFLGDGIMAFWSAFETDEAQAARACKAAVACQAALQKVNEELAAEDVPPIALRVGIATGTVIVGDCGAPPALHDYTVIGDAVNLAARLESANKHFGTSMLIDGTTHDRVDDFETTFRGRGLGRVLVVGQSHPVGLFELRHEETPEELLDLTAQAVDAFGAGRFEEAMKTLDAIDQQFGPSPLVRTFLEAMASVDDQFDGVLRLASK